MPDDGAPVSTSNLKPGFSTSEGRITLLVVVVSCVSSVLPVLTDAYPDQPVLKAATSAVALLISGLIALGWMKRRNELKIVDLQTKAIIEGAKVQAAIPKS